MILSLEPREPDSGVEEAWESEIERRVDAADRGESKLIDWRESVERARRYSARARDNECSLLEVADTEFMAAAQWYENELAGLGERFISEVIDAFLSIELHPKRFPRCRYRSSREFRNRRLTSFPHSVVYEVRETECVVVAIAHPSRRPNYWRDQI